MEAMSEPECHHRTWGLPVLNVKMVENHILWQWKRFRRVCTCRVAKQRVLQVWRHWRWVPYLIFIPWICIVVTWIRWSRNFKSRNSRIFLHHDQIIRSQYNIKSPKVASFLLTLSSLNWLLMLKMTTQMVNNTKTSSLQCS
jgi:hypothetical protein